VVLLAQHSIFVYVHVTTFVSYQLCCRYRDWCGSSL